LKLRRAAKRAAHNRGRPCKVNMQLKELAPTSNGGLGRDYRAQCRTRRSNRHIRLTVLAPTRLQIMSPNRKPLYWKCIESRMRKPG